jgi:hypothetical protein
MGRGGLRVRASWMFKRAGVAGGLNDEKEASKDGEKRSRGDLGFGDVGVI